MKIICTRENFKKAIINSERIVSKQTTLPILNNILLETEKNNLKISATNLELGIVLKVSAKIEQEGGITIPAKTIGGFVGNLPTENENIRLEVIGQELKIKSGALKATIKGLLADDFPLIPPKKENFLFSMPCEALRGILLKVLSCTAINEMRQELTGVDVVFTEEFIFFAATDSFRLAEGRFKFKKEEINQDIYNIFIKKIDNIIIPASTLVELLRIISGELGTVIVTVEEGQIFFEVGNARIVSRLISGKYPEYKHIIPTSFKTRIVGKKSDICGAVKMASVFALGKTGEVFLEARDEDKKISIGAKNVEVGENVSEIKLDISGPTQKVVFNPRYLLDGLNSVTTLGAAIFINNETSPVAIKEIDEKTGMVLEDFIYIVMPIKN